MSLTKVSFGRSAVYKSTIDANDVNSFIDIKLNTLKDTTVSSDTQTGIPNTADVLTTKVKINSTVCTISSAGSSVQTLGQLVSQINTGLGVNGSCVLIGTEKRIRIKSAVTGNIPIDKIEVGTLINSIIGVAGEPVTAEYLPGVTGGGACYEISNVATADNPVDAIWRPYCESSGLPKTTIKVSYDSTKGTLLVMDDGTNEFAVGDIIAVEVNTY